jgi:hypothetical protein
MYLTISLTLINLISIITIFYLNKTIYSLQQENQKLIGNIQNLNHEILYLKENKVEGLESTVLPTITEHSEILGLLGICTALSFAVCGLTFLVFLKNDTTVIAELSKNSIKTTGEYVKEVIVPSIELLNKSSEARITANLTNLQSVVTDTGTVLTNHITEVNKEGILCIVNTIKPQVSTKILGKISTELLNYIP